MLTQDPSGTTLAPAWWPEAMLWIGLFLVLLVGAGLGLLWMLHARLERLTGGLAPLSGLAELERSVRAALAQRDGADLRRIEHLLIELRDGARRLEEELLRLAEARGSGEAGTALVPVVSASVAERIQNRLYALGYERVELVTPGAEIEALAQGEGEVRVEARREGALCKGRVRLRAGRIEAVQLAPAYPIFP